MAMSAIQKHEENIPESVITPFVTCVSLYFGCSILNNADSKGSVKGT